MVEPTFADYVKLLYTLFDEFLQQLNVQGRRGHPFVYQHQTLMVVFVIMQCKRIFKFKAQRRWLDKHPEWAEQIGLTEIPDRTTLSRRYKALYEVVPAFITFIAQHYADVAEALASDHLYTDKSLFKAQGPVWHQSDRKADRIPDKLRHLDTDASWSKSGYHGWVYGYGLHFVCNLAGFPAQVQVETGSVAESTVLDANIETIITQLRPITLTGDNRFAKATRIRQWATQGVILLTPAAKWIKGRFAQAYHRFIQEPDNAELLATRRTAIEPMFDLIAKAIGTSDPQKQLPIQGLSNVRTCLALGVLTIQLAMLVNSIWGLPLRDIAHLLSVFP